ncbi:MAG: aldo/keto reductase [Gemmatimonadota bacterium]|nr:aldo/keto reductase [Gemmatimonadota bacterium]
MNYVRLGRTGLKVSEYCIGADNFGGQTDVDESLRIMGAAFDGGVNFIDTANSYCDGRSETIVGKFIQGRRSEVVLATKGNSRVGDGPNDMGVSRKYVMQAIDDSLKRLNTDYVDLYQIHSFPTEVAVDEFVQAYSDVVEAGKARYIGVSNFAGHQLAESLWQAEKSGARRFDCVQPKYNLLVRDPERELFPACSEYGVGVIAYSPQAGGFLLGKHRNFTAESGGRFSDDFRAAAWYRATYWSQPMFDAMEQIVQVAENYGVSANALALRWVISNSVVTSCIVGARTEEQLHSNLLAWEEDVPQDALEEATKASESVRTTFAQV